MARLHVRANLIDDIGAVPDELKHADAAVWRDPASLQRWCGRNLREPPSPRHLEMLARGAPGGRWRVAVDRWAVENGFSRDWPKLPDWRRLRRAGVPAPSSLPRPRIIAAEYEGPGPGPMITVPS